MVRVTPLVKSTTLETMLEAALWTERTVEAANSDPGNRGSDMPPPLEGAEGVGMDARRAVGGRVYHHQPGT